MKGTVNQDCYSVKVFFNFTQLHLPGCAKIDCNYPEFEQLIAKNSYSDKNLQTLCSTTHNTSQSPPSALPTTQNIQ